MSKTEFQNNSNIPAPVVHIIPVSTTLPKGPVLFYFKLKGGE